MPITPSGVDTRAISSPFGCCHRANSWPIGSVRRIIASRPVAIASTRSSFSVNRSIKAPLMPLALAAATSLALTSRMAADWVRISLAAACKAAHRDAKSRLPRTDCAARDRVTIAPIRAVASLILSSCCAISFPFFSPSFGLIFQPIFI